MKIIFLCIGLFLLVSCSYPYNTTVPPNKEAAANIEPLVSKILFVGKNAMNGAYYNIIISCVDGAPQGINEIPDTETVEIILMKDCMKHKIPKETLDIITNKKFYYVYWDFYYQGPMDDQPIYQIDNEEAIKIGKAQWKIQALDGISWEQAKIIRNTKNTIREAFEPTGNRNFYTEEEGKKCDIFWKGSENIQDMKLWKIYADKVLRCYRELPPLTQ